MGSLHTDVTARLLAAAGDVALVLDEDGVIRDIAIGNDELAADGAGDWLDRRWIDVVTSDSRKKVDEMIRDAGVAGPQRWRQVNHLLTSGEVPIRYLTVGAGPDGRVIAIGRDLRATAALQQRLLQAQQSMERDYVRLRRAESRYRLLFDLSSEAVMIVDAGTRRIVEANPAAEALAGKGKIVGQPMTALVGRDEVDSVIALLGAVAAAGQSGPIRVTVGGNRARCRLAASLFRQDRGAAFLVRLTPEGAATDQPSAPSLAEVLERVPDAFVITDHSMVVIAHNESFLELTELAGREDVLGRPLGDFLGRPGIDLGLMATQLREHGAVRNFATIVRGRYETQEDVEVSAVTAPDGERGCYAFTLRTVTRSREPTLTGVDVPRSVEQLTDLVGRVSLKEIVRESTDLIERLCIEAALTHTSDNRASAAEILGLSRQSLYSKLYRHGLAVPSEPDGEPAKP